MTEAILESVLTCPHCGYSKQEIMPTEACQFYYACEGCAALQKLLLMMSETESVLLSNQKLGFGHAITTTSDRMRFSDTPA